MGYDANDTAQITEGELEELKQDYRNVIEKLQAAIATRNEEVKELEAEIERRIRSADKILERFEQLQAQVAMKDGALSYLMQQFDGETWQCPTCGHAEDTSTMDSATWLRDFLANASPSNWLEKKLLEARIDEADSAVRVSELHRQLAALEGEKE
jgi:DNA repair exonuclease SbcCD ATPase subunit